MGDDMVNDIDGAKKCWNDHSLDKNNSRQLNGKTVPDKVIDHWSFTKSHSRNSQ